LGFATSGELAAFWALIGPAEAKEWVARGLASGDVVVVDVECAGGDVRMSVMRPEVLAGVAELPAPGPRLRILSPFDPALRDRARAERLFGFSYRIEIFVPEARRRYGYYVFPVLEGALMAGRIDMRKEAGGDTVIVRAFWPEPGIRMGAGRRARLIAEIERAASFAGSGEIAYEPGWIRGNS